MERNRNYDSGNRYNRRNNNPEDNLREHLSNYQDRYTSQGNYYGMADEGATYRNTRSMHGSNYGHNTPGPVAGYGAGSYRGAYEGQNRYRNDDSYSPGMSRNHGSSGSRNQEHYHYGDPNPYMHNDRNTRYGRSNDGGYEYNESNRQGSAHQHYSGDYEPGYRDNDDYARQDNSYQMSGKGRHFNEFARDEQRSYNPVTVDASYDRGDFRQSRSDNNYGSGRGRGSSNYYDGNFDNEDFRYGNAEIRETDRSRERNRNRRDNYGSGLYASNRSYLADHENERSRRSSGPDYSADSAISGFGQSDLRG